MYFDFMMNEINWVLVSPTKYAGSGIPINTYIIEFVLLIRVYTRIFICVALRWIAEYNIQLTGGLNLLLRKLNPLSL